MKRAFYQTSFIRKVAAGQLVTLFDLLPDVCFFIKDAQCRFVGLNPRGCEYCGLTSGREAMGLTDHDFFPRSRADAYLRDDRTVLRTGRPIINRIESAPEEEGSARMVITCKIPLRNRAGEIIGLAGFSREVESIKERPAGSTRLEKVLAHLRNNHQEKHTTARLAGIMGQSASQFERTFRQKLGTSPRQYLLRIRVEAACRKLAESELTLAAIAQECGFYDHAHFTRCFRKVMNTTPSEYRNEHQRPTTR